jgi:hypothetical protein
MYFSEGTLGTLNSDLKVFEDLQGSNINLPIDHYFEQKRIKSGKR